MNELSIKLISGEYDMGDTILVDADKKTKKLVFMKKGEKKAVVKKVVKKTVKKVEKKADKA